MVEGGKGIRRVVLVPEWVEFPKLGWVQLCAQHSWDMCNLHRSILEVEAGGEVPLVNRQQLVCLKY